MPVFQEGDHFETRRSGAAEGERAYYKQNQHILRFHERQDEENGFRHVGYEK